MNRNLALIVGVALIGIGMWVNLPSAVTPDVPPMTPLAQSLVDAMSKTDDRSHAARDARLLASLCGELAECLDYDASLQEPRLLTAVQVDELRRYAREYQLRGVSLGVLYPDIRPVLRDHFDRAVNKDGGGRLEPDERTRWVESFRALGDAALAASSQL